MMPQKLTAAGFMRVLGHTARSIQPSADNAQDKRHWQDPEGHPQKIQTQRIVLRARIGPQLSYDCEANEDSSGGNHAGP